MGYPTIKEEMILMSQRKVSDPLDDVNEVISKEELLSMQKEVNEIKVSSLIYQYIAMLSDATRRHDMIQLVSAQEDLWPCAEWQKRVHFWLAEIMLCRKMFRML